MGIDDAQPRCVDRRSGAGFRPLQETGARTLCRLAKSLILSDFSFGVETVVTVFFFFSFRVLNRRRDTKRSIRRQVILFWSLDMTCIAEVGLTGVVALSYCSVR